jgi:hypothetical protein
MHMKGLALCLAHRRCLVNRAARRACRSGLERMHEALCSNLPKNRAINGAAIVTSGFCLFREGLAM